MMHGATNNAKTMILGNTPPAVAAGSFTNCLGSKKIIVQDAAVSNYGGEGALWKGWLVNGGNEDATLSDIRINGVSITGFNPATTTYNLPDTGGSSISITAITNHSNATVIGTGSKSLGMGSNSCTME